MRWSRGCFSATCSRNAASSSRHRGAASRCFPRLLRFATTFHTPFRRLLPDHPQLQRPLQVLSRPPEGSHRDYAALISWTDWLIDRGVRRIEFCGGERADHSSGASRAAGSFQLARRQDCADDECPRDLRSTSAASAGNGDEGARELARRSAAPRRTGGGRGLRPDGRKPAPSPRCRTPMLDPGNSCCGRESGARLADQLFSGAKGEAIGGAAVHRSRSGKGAPG
jgi:hypothetical protein